MARPDFDPSADLVVAKPMILGHDRVSLKPDPTKLFDKSLIPDRHRLKVLYEQRYFDIADPTMLKADDPPVVEAPKPKRKAKRNGGHP